MDWNTDERAARMDFVTRKMLSSARRMRLSLENQSPSTCFNASFDMLISTMRSFVQMYRGVDTTHMSGWKEERVLYGLVMTQ